jgi:DNA-binding CsgD family transcriptional regulator
MGETRSKVEREIASGWQALAEGAWAKARASFEAALARKETAEALEGLSWSAWWLNDADTLFRSREQAYRLWRAAGDTRSAARMAVWISSDYIDFRGEPAVASGWRERARRLLEGLEPCAEHGWLLLFDGAFALELEEDPATAARLAAEAAAIGRRVGVVDVEMLGLAMEGLALVTQGRVIEGMRRLDEATAAALAGEFREIFSVAWALCYLVYACERVRDYDRAAQWCDKMKEFAARMQVRFLLGICRAHYAGVLIYRGAWDEADAELAGAIEELAATRPPMAAEGLVRLAELRRRQGRLEEASRLFAEAEGHAWALLGRAEIELDGGRPAEAEALAQRLLRQMPADNKVQRLHALEVLIRAQLALGNIARGRETLEALRAVASGIATGPVEAATSFAAGIVACAGADFDGACRHLEDAVDLYERSRAPFEAARARIELAGSLVAIGRPDAAAAELTAAQASLREMGARREAERAAGLLAQLQRVPARSSSGASLGLTRREVEVLHLVADGLNDKEIASALTLSEHTVHRHISNILAKLGLSSRAAAVAHAVRHGLL